MSGDLISRESVIKALKAKGRELFKLGLPFEVEIATMTAFECVNIVKDAPAVDAVEVVRCKDCVYWKRLDEHIGKCPFLIGEHQYAGSDHYCSCGERKEDNIDG